MDIYNTPDGMEIYDRSVNNPEAQNFLEQSAFLKFVVQQLKKMVASDGSIIGDVAKYNSLVQQLERGRAEINEIREKFINEKKTFEELFEKLNQRRRHLSQLIMQMTRQAGNGSLEQKTYLQKKYQLEMKRKGLGNQMRIVKKNVSLYKELLRSTIPNDTFEFVEEEFEAPHELGEDDALQDSDYLMEQSTDGITFMGVLSSDIEKAILEKKKGLMGQGKEAEPENNQPLNPRLNIITETGKQYFYPLDPAAAVRIGRSSQNDIQIPSPAVSRNHAEIRFEEGGFVVLDLESSNGTFVNDKMVIRRKIEPNDTITIGGTRLVYLT